MAQSSTTRRVRSLAIALCVIASMVCDAGNGHGGIGTKHESVDHCDKVVDLSLLSRQRAVGRLLKVQYVARCVTPAGTCFLQTAAPMGTPCWCATPYGPVGGRVG